ARDRHNVANEFEIKLVVERRIGRVKRTDKEKRIAVRARAHDRLGSHIAAGTRSVLDNKRLTETLRQPLGYQARDDIRPAAGRKTDNDAHWSRGISLCPCEARDGRQRGSARGEMQESTARSCHGGPSQRQSTRKTTPGFSRKEGQPSARHQSPNTPAS